MAKAKNLPPITELTPPQVVNLVQTEAEHVDAELVRINRSRVRELHAEEAELTRSGACSISGGTVTTRGSWVGSIRADAATLQGGGVVAIQAQRMELDGKAGLVSTDSLNMAEGSTVGILSAGQVKAEKVRTVVLLARKVEGQVETALDTRRVLLASLVAGVAAGAVILLGEILFRRKNR